LIGHQIIRWSFEELREISKRLGFPETTIYQNSLEWRWQRADFHAEMANKVWEDLFKSTFSTGDQRFRDSVFSYEANVEACVQSLHSLGDMLAQIINVVILKSHFGESQVSALRVARAIVEPKILTPLNKFLGSYEFRYVDAFCNTIKHRRLIRSEFGAEYGEDYRNETGIKFIQFNYGNTTYHETWGSDIVGEYRYVIRDRITQVGIVINEFLRERLESI
jgi:hypothetical protein